MPKNKKQLERLVKLASMLKQGEYPNAVKFSDMLCKADLYDNENIACTPKTIRRDIQYLKEKCHAPIEFDYKRNGYYVTHTGWDLYFPVLQDEVMLASLLGSRLAQDLMPEPIKTEITDAVDRQLTTNSPDFLDTAFIDSLIAASGVKVRIEPDIFLAVFTAWQKHMALDIKYRDKDGEVSDRRIEPHVLTYYNSAWYIKGVCYKQDDIRVFAIHRIIEAEDAGFFEPDPLLIQRAKGGKIFEYKTISDIEIRCSKAIAGYVCEQHEFYDEQIQENKDGSVTVHVPAAPEHEIVKWILSEAGNAKVIKPKSLAKKIVAAAEKVILENKT